MIFNKRKSLSKQKIKSNILILFKYLLIINFCFGFINFNGITKGLFDDEIDQQQTHGDIAVPLYDRYQISQSFIPALGNLTRIQLCISKLGDIQTNITVGIRKQISSQDIANVSIKPENVSDEQQWIQFNFSGVELTTEIKYYLICSVNGGDENNSYYCYVSDNNSYESGINYYSSDGGISWEQNVSRDLCFKTYAKEIIRPASLEITYITSAGGAQIDYGITNSGESDLENINILMKIDGGIIFTGRSWTDEYDGILEPGEMAERFFFPVMGIGFSKVTIYAWTEENSLQVNKSRDVLFLPFYIYVKPV